MIRTICLSAVVFLSACFSPVYSEEALHPEWIEADKVFISKVLNTLKNTPDQLDKVLVAEDRKLELGFGYKINSGGNGKGYVSIFYQFIYKDGRLVSFRLKPQMPDDKRLIPVYRDIYTDLFTFDENSKIAAYDYNLSAMQTPLPGFTTTRSISPRLRYYMTPYSGTTYAIRGGYANSLLENRENFLAVKNELNNETVMLLLYSINPASRLTAYEYYRIHKQDFSLAERDKIEKRMEMVFRESPEITTMHGCMVTTEKSRDRVLSILQEQENRTQSEHGTSK